MNAITIGGFGRSDQPQTMSSREIAELTGKEHKHVIRDIRVMLEALGDGPDLGHVQELKDSRGYTSEFLLDRDLTLNLVTGYDAALRMRVIKRLAELEEQKRPDPLVALNDPATMRGLLLTYSEKVILLEQVNAELAPKADALDHIANTDGSYAPTDAAKTLGVRPKDLFEYLRGPAKWMYRRVGTSEDVAYQDKLQRGLMEHKVKIIPRPDGSEKTITRARITAKGLAYLAEIFSERKDAA